MYGRIGYGQFCKVRNVMEKMMEQSVVRFYRLLNISGYLVKLLKAHNIFAVVLKGPDLAGYYPVPEYREFGDVDLLLLDARQTEEAVEILKNDGLKVNKRQDSKHHVEMTYEGKYIVELHSFATRYFSEQSVNKQIKDIFAISPEEIVYHEVCGVLLPVLPKDLNGLYILLHTLQHYLNAGFGVRILNDFKVFFSEMNSKEIQSYKRYVKELKISGFSDILTQTATELCGLSKERALELFVFGVPDRELLLKFREDIISSGTFGEQDASRLVNLSEPSLKGLLKEFHHQMHENFPMAGRCFLLWPFLWVATFLIFMCNNIFVRKSFGIDIVKKSLSRSTISKQIELWKR